MSPEVDLRHKLIFLLAGPELGFVGFCLAAAISHGPKYFGFLVPGSLLLLPFIYVVGALPAMLTCFVDEALAERGNSRITRAVLCGILGALLSQGLFYVAPFPLAEFRPDGYLNGLPGAVAGLVCSYWASKEKRLPKTRSMGWSAGDRT